MQLSQQPQKASFSQRTSPANSRHYRVIQAVLILLVAFSSSFAYGGTNKAYRTLKEIKLIDKPEGGWETLQEIAKGDTIFTTAESEQYIAGKEGHELKFLPVEYKGRKGYVYTSDIYPVKTCAEDTLKYVQLKAIDDREAEARFLVPQMEWAMNHTSTPMEWFYIIFVTLAVGGISLFFALKRASFKNIGLIITGGALVVVSAAEIMYALAFHDNYLWFVMPSIVGGWGHTILNFIILSVALAIQAFLFFEVWAESLMDCTGEVDIDDSKYKWIIFLGALPLAIAVLLMIVKWVDHFQDNTMSPDIYLIVFGLLAVAALCGMGLFLAKKKVVNAVIIPVLYVLGGVGFAYTAMILGMLLVLVAIVGAIAVGVLLMLLGALGGTLFGKQRITFKDEHGNIKKGYKNDDGTIKGDDGNIYITK